MLWLTSPGQQNISKPMMTWVHWFVFTHAHPGLYTVHDWKYAHGMCLLHYVVVVWYRRILPISFRVTSLALRHWYDFPSASEAILKNMGKLLYVDSLELIAQPRKTKQNETKQCIHVFYGIFWMCQYPEDLTHGLVTLYGDIDLGQNWCR